MPLNTRDFFMFELSTGAFSALHVLPVLRRNILRLHAIIKSFMLCNGVPCVAL